MPANLEFADYVFNCVVEAYYITSTRRPAQDPAKVVQEIFEESADWGANDGVPSPKTMSLPRRAELEQRVRDGISAGDPESFRVAAAQFRRDKPWLTGDERHPYAANDSWAELAMSHSFKRLVKRGREFEAQVAAANEKMHAKLRENDWAEYLRVADVPKWPGMAADDEALVDAAIADKGAEPRDIDKKTLERCREVCGNFHRHKRGELEALRRELFADTRDKESHNKSRLVKMYKRAIELKVHRSELNARTAPLRDRISDAKSVEQLHECARVIDAMNAELDRVAANLAAASAAAKPSVSPKRGRRRRL